MILGKVLNNTKVSMYVGMYVEQQTVSRNNTSTKTSILKNKQVLENGPLYTMFPCSTSKVMDFMITFHRYDYSISDIAKNSGVAFKTGLNEVRKLENEGIIVFTRNVGKAMLYKINPDSTKAKSMRKLALDIAVKKAKEQTS